MQSFSNRWQMMSSNAFSLLHAKGWTFSKYKFHQFLKTTDQLWYLLDPGQRTWPKAARPIVLSVTAPVVFLLDCVSRNEILSSLTSWNVDLHWLPVSTSCLFLWEKDQGIIYPCDLYAVLSIFEPQHWSELKLHCSPLRTLGELCF